MTQRTRIRHSFSREKKRFYAFLFMVWYSSVSPLKTVQATDYDGESRGLTTITGTTQRKESSKWKLFSGFRWPWQKGKKKKKGVFRYNICNGLSNQLLYHAAGIAQAVRGHNQFVEIPDYFILQGTQSSNQFIMPNDQNSVPFGHVFDQDYFLEFLQTELDITGRIVQFPEPTNIHKMPRCKAMDSLVGANPMVMQKVIRAFQPSPKHLKPIVDAILQKMQQPGHDDHNTKQQEGVCLHHRDGQDWHDHCARWSVIEDAMYRGNCLTVQGQTFLQALQARELDRREALVYYCGDHSIPEELLVDQSKQHSSTFSTHAKAYSPPAFSITSRQNIIQFNDTDHTIRNLLSRQQTVLQDELGLTHLDLSTTRDFWALIDFYVCKTLRLFVGNSVSTFSAIQIALRDGSNTAHAYWYNSQSIPLQYMWKVFHVPIVYTYTELSAATGKHLLQTSIESARQHMPGTPIHILYNGHQDTNFRAWLQSRNVILHQHEPDWKDQIEEMRRNGDPKASHLFNHAGNYFGTWQRIDIPHFLKSEYALLLDADTIVRRPFSLADFGLNLTHSVAMSSEINYEDLFPSNAGVTLMNIPFLRHTHDEFIQFILRHVKTGGNFDHPCPSDQGAYLVFYNETVSFLSQLFNFKPYWPPDDRLSTMAFINHFHGPKPHDYVRFIMGKGCDEAFKMLCIRGVKFSAPLLCRSLAAFAKASLSVDRYAYCAASFSTSPQVQFCQSLMETLADNSHQCNDFYSVIREALDKVPFYMRLPRGRIVERLGLEQDTHFTYWIVSYMGVVFGWLALAYYSYRQKQFSTQRLFRLVMVGFFGWTTLTLLFAVLHLGT